MFVGLVGERRWEPPDQPEPSPRRWRPSIPWRPIVWIGGWLALMYGAAAVGGFVGYLMVVFAVGLGSWRLERWCAGQYWSGLNEYGRVG